MLHLLWKKALRLSRPSSLGSSTHHMPPRAPSSAPVTALKMNLFSDLLLHMIPFYVSPKSDLTNISHWNMLVPNSRCLVKMFCWSLPIFWTQKAVFSQGSCPDLSSQFFSPTFMLTHSLNKYLLSANCVLGTALKIQWQKHRIPLLQTSRYSIVSKSLCGKYYYNY